MPADAVSPVMRAALDRLIAPDRDLPEGGAIPAVDPVLDAPVAAEKAAAEAFPADAPPHRADRDLAAEADRLHRDLTQGADPAPRGR